MATNKFLIFDENKANLQSDLTYASDPQRINGVAPGQAKSVLHNKLFRQVSIMTYALGELIKDKGIQVDDSDPAILVSALSTLIEGSGLKIPISQRFVIGTSAAGWTEDDVDYLCDGVADNVQINAAIQALPAAGGEIKILDGTYNLASKIIVDKNNVLISGCGFSTVLSKGWSATVYEGIITLSAASKCCIEKLRFSGGSDNFISAIYLGAACDENIISNNNITGLTSGVTILSSSNNIISNNIISGCLQYGVQIKSSSENVVSDNRVKNCSRGIDIDSSQYIVVTGNSCYARDYGIHTNASDWNVVSGNICRGATTGIELSNFSYGAVSGNNCSNNDIGIRLSFNSHVNTVSGNTCVRGTGIPSDYAGGLVTRQTIYIYYTYAKNNLVCNNNCMGKAVVNEADVSNTLVNNKST